MSNATHAYCTSCPAWVSPPNFSTAVMEASLKQYAKLPKKGKPKLGAEWTPLSTIILLNSGDNSLKVVALGTGSKCIGQNRICKEGWVVNDSHAEVIARRVFVRYLLHQLKAASEGKGSVFELHGTPTNTNTYKLKEGLTYHFFSSHIPCGDACIFPQDSIIDLNKRKRIIGTAAPTKSLKHPKLSKGVLPTQESLETESTPQGSEYTHMSSDCKCVSPDSPNICQSTNCVCSTFENTEYKEEAILPEYNSPEKLEKDCVNRCATENTPIAVNVDTTGLISAKYACAHCPQTESASEPSEQVVDTVHNDIHRTGAKCVKGGPQDKKLPGLGYHQTGLLRTKPGRGDPTLSMCCSDKLMRWNLLGAQGAALSHCIVHPIYFQSVVVYGKLFNFDAMHRALCRRLAHCELGQDLQECGYHIHYPKIFHCIEAPIHDHELRESYTNVTPSSELKLSPLAVCWSPEPLSHEVIVQGVKQGVNTKKTLGKTASVTISKHNLFGEIMDWILSLPRDNRPPSLRGDIREYRSLKMAASSHWNARSTFLKHFPQWLSNDSKYELFCHDSNSKHMLSH